MQAVFSFLMSLAVAPALAQVNSADRPLIEAAPVLGLGDYVWLIPIVGLLIVAAIWYLLRRDRTRR